MYNETRPESPVPVERQTPGRNAPSSNCYARSVMARVNSKSKGAQSPAPLPRKPRIVRIAERLGRQIPEDELRLIPKDLSSQVDHYVYGTPKK